MWLLLYVFLLYLYIAEMLNTIFQLSVVNPKIFKELIIWETTESSIFLA